MTELTVSRIAEIVDGCVSGTAEERISGLAGIREAVPGQLTFLAKRKYLPFLSDTRASAVLIDQSIICETDKTIIRVQDASRAFNRIVSFFFPHEETFSREISPRSEIHESVRVGNNVCIQPFVVIEPDVTVGSDTVIQSGSYIGRGTSIGSGCRIYPNVTILKRTRIGNRVVIHSGTVIGSDGFGFDPGEGLPEKILQVGRVVVEDDVEIGSNVTIDRARLEKTVIGKGSKIDNLVHIAHNVEIGENCLLLAQVGLAGTTVLGNGVIMAGQSGATGHLRIHDKVIVTSKAGVTKDIPARTIVSGFPAHDHGKFKRVTASLLRLPELLKRIKLLETRILERNAQSSGYKHEKPEND
jgi:UDP-3-O-[3-hydroxymyristoyl] glucosamine N-acyltransferase